LLTSKKLNKQFFHVFLLKLIEKDEQIISGSQKFYINSMAHRERFRLWQTLLTLFPKIDKSDYNNLFDYSEKNLLNENQPSTRVLTEWVIIRIVLSKLEKFDLDYFWRKIDHFTKKKVNKIFNC
jgi:hypothetical protein